MKLFNTHITQKAIIGVHWGGNLCDIESIAKISKDNKLKFIEGRYSDFACFSFQSIKSLTCGDGGLLVCNNEEDYFKARNIYKLETSFY